MPLALAKKPPKRGNAIGDPTPDSGSRPAPYLKPKGSRHARNASSQGTGLQFAGFRGHQYRSQ
jgi:hypothetical protein